MKPSDRSAESDRVFNEPWEAQAFAMTVALHERGLFTWAEWAQILGAEIKSDPERPYYEQWLAALESLLEEKNAFTRLDRLGRIEAWREAARRTPHGMPVELGPLTSK